MKHITKGVPQGSVLGPILFLMYINDIVHSTNKSKLLLYADDTTVLVSDGDINSISIKIKLELIKVNNWIQANKLKLNMSKTKVLLFQNRSLNYSLQPIILNGNIIEQVCDIKFLGLVIDQHLSWGSHIDYICHKLSRLIGVLYRVRRQLTSEAMLSIYYSLFYPHMIYCVSLWASTWPSFVDRLGTLQKKIIRCIFFLKKFESTTQIFYSYKLLKFQYVHRLCTLLTIYKSFKCCDTSLFALIKYDRTVRSSSVDLRCPVFRTTLFKNSLFCFGPMLFNSLPTDYKRLLTTSNFAHSKISLKRYFRKQQSNELFESENLLTIR